MNLQRTANLLSRRPPPLAWHCFLFPPGPPKVNWAQFQQRIWPPAFSHYRMAHLVRLRLEVKQPGDTTKIAPQFRSRKTGQRS